MKILLIHHNFPGQFKHLAPALLAEGHRVRALPLRNDTSPSVWKGVELVPYHPDRGSTSGIHPWVVDIEAKTIRGEAVFRHAVVMRDREGYNPDIIIAHPGWGESLFLKDVWPEVKLGIYCEYYYQEHATDAEFDPEFARHDPGDGCRLWLKNINNILHFSVADAGISPTVFQASTFPESFREKISVIHDGIDTRKVKPNQRVYMQMQTEKGKLTLRKKDEVITFVNRNLEPYRGYHVFMRTLPELLRRRPNARVLIVGGNNVSYGAGPPEGKTWKQVFIDEVRQDIPNKDWARVHFLGKIPYEHFVSLLQLSTVHVYLSYPFVLSWSLLEAMSAGCAIVASDTEPVREAIEHGVNGRLVDFFDRQRLCEEISALLDDPVERNRLGAAARQHVTEQYDLQECLARQIAWVNALAAG